jgi:hypothetical protein
VTGWPWPVDAIQGYIEAIANAVFNIPNLLNEFKKTLEDFIAAGFKSVYDFFISAFSQLGSLISGAIESVINTIKGLFDAAVNSVKSFVESIIEFGKSALQVITNLPNMIWDSLVAAGQAIYNFFNWFAGVIFNFFTQQLLPAIWSGLQAIYNFFASILGTVKNIIFQLVNMVKVQRPEDALNVAMDVFMVTGVFSVISYSLEIIKEIKGLGSGVAFDLPGREFVKDFGIDKIQTAILAAPILIGLMPFLERYFRSLYRSGLPSTAQVDQMLIQMNISEEQWRQRYIWEGWPDELIAAWRKTLYIQPSDFLLARMFETPQISTDWIKLKLLERGYSEFDANQLIQFFIYNSLKDEIKALKSSLVRAYSEGYLSEQDLLDNLTSLQLSQQEIQLTNQLAKLQLAINIKQEMVKANLQMFKNNLLSEQELRNNLLSILAEPGLVDAIVSRYKFLKKVEKQVDILSDEYRKLRSVAFDLYSKGFMSKQEFIETLQFTGLTQEEIQVLLKAADLAFFRTITSEQVKLILMSFEKDLITEEEALAELLNLGIEETRARILLQNSIIKKEGRRRPSK